MQLILINVKDQPFTCSIESGWWSASAFKLCKHPLKCCSFHPHSQRTSTKSHSLHKTFRSRDTSSRIGLCRSEYIWARLKFLSSHGTKVTASIASLIDFLMLPKTGSSLSTSYLMKMLIAAGLVQTCCVIPNCICKGWFRGQRNFVHVLSGQFATFQYRCNCKSDVFFP